jgi:hypothetical protein
VLFTSGWENSGGNDITDGGIWTSITNHPEVVTSPMHEGKYAALCNNQFGDIIIKQFTAQTQGHARVYFQYDTNPGAGNYLELLLFVDSTSRNGMILRIYNTAGTIQWGLYAYEPPAWNTYLAASPTPQPNVWYSIELEWTGNTVGGDKVYLDGINILQGTSATDIISVDEFDCISYGVAGANLYFDDVIIADSYIGTIIPSNPLCQHIRIH